MRRSLPVRGRWRIPAVILLWLTLIVFVWVMTGAVAAGWLMHADHYGAEFRVYGILMLCAAGLMTVSALLSLLRFDLPAVILDAAAYLPMLVIMLLAVGTAERAGWSGQTAESFGRTAAAVWRNGLIWNGIPFVLILLHSFTRYFSYDNRLQRAAKNEESTVSASLVDD